MTYLRKVISGEAVRCSSQSDPSRVLMLRCNVGCDGAHLGRYAGCGVTERYRAVSAAAVETSNGVANEKARSLGSAVLVTVRGAFVSVLRNYAEIVRAHADGESAHPAARPFPQGSHSLGRCRHGGIPPQ
jgi:hypothetical protein